MISHEDNGLACHFNYAGIWKHSGQCKIRYFDENFIMSGLLKLNHQDVDIMDKVGNYH